MVKPSLKPESEKEKKEVDLKDDKLKEWGVLPAAVVIDESEKAKDKKDAEAAMEEFDNMETDVAVGPRRPLVKCCACFAVFTILLIVFCTVGSFLYFHYGDSDHKWNGWCSVKYGDDNDSEEKGRHEGHHGDGSHGSGERHHGRPYGNDALYPPRPTGPPGGRTCNQQSQVDLDTQLERVDRPQEQECERLTILHDYNVNISAYRLWKSEICYVTWIEEDILLNPQEFWTNMQDPSYLNQWFDELTLTYRAVLPEIPTPLHAQEDGKYGEYLDGPQEFLCQGTNTYWIEKIPDEELIEFMAMIDQIMQQLMAQAAAYDTDMAEGQGRPHHGRHGEGYPEGGEEAMPWEDFMPLGHPGEQDEWGMGPHGGRDQDREEGEEHRRHEPHGERMRRNVKDRLQKIKEQGRLQKMKQMADKGKKCMEQLKNNKMSEIGKYVVNVRAVPPCIMEMDAVKGYMAKIAAAKK